MSDFAGMEDLLQDFLVEAGDLLSDVDNKLVELEHSPEDPGLLNDIFRGFHTIKGGRASSAQPNWSRCATSPRASSTACASTSSRSRPSAWT